MSDDNFNWDLTIAIPRLPCLLSIAKAVSSNVDLVNSDCFDSGNSFDFVMCSFGSK